ALHAAVMNGSSVIVQSLINSKAKVDEVNQQGVTSLRRLVCARDIPEENKLVKAKILIEAGADCEIREAGDGENISLDACARRQGYHRLAYYLLNRDLPPLEGAT